jgi:putative ABC transport system permease protein
MTSAGNLPRAEEIGIDAPVLLFTIGAALLTGILFGLAPIVPLAFQNLQASLKDTVGSTTSTTGAQGFRKALVAGELAMALVLLIGCGLMVRGFWKLQEVNTGINASHVITMEVALPAATYTKPEAFDAFWTRLQENLNRLPGVQSAGLASGLPPIRPPNMNDTHIEGYVRKENGPVENVDYYQAVTKEYFKTMGIHLIDGRLFDERDAAGAPETVIVNQTMARTFWGNESPVGHRVQPGSSKDPICTVVGVVEDVKNAGLDKPTGTELYLPYAQKYGSGAQNMAVVLRAQGDPASLVGAVRREVQAIDSTVPVAHVRTMDDVLSSAQSRPRFLTMLLTLFSGVALIIATVGIYGVISYSVVRRSKEFGLRMALGAQQKDVLGLVMKQGAALALIGVGVGIAAAFGLTRLMSSLLFGVRPTDAVTFVTVSALLGFIALCASYIPARRATQVDPMKALRYE